MKCSTKYRRGVPSENKKWYAFILFHVLRTFSWISDPYYTHTSLTPGKRSPLPIPRLLCRGDAIPQHLKAHPKTRLVNGLKNTVLTLDRPRLRVGVRVRSRLPIPTTRSSIEHSNAVWKFARAWWRRVILGHSRFFPRLTGLLIKAGSFLLPLHHHAQAILHTKFESSMLEMEARINLKPTDPILGSPSPYPIMDRKSIMVILGVMVRLRLHIRAQIFLFPGVLKKGATRHDGLGHSCIQHHSGYSYPLNRGVLSRTVWLTADTSKPWVTITTRDLWAILS